MACFFVIKTYNYSEYYLSIPTLNFAISLNFSFFIFLKNDYSMLCTKKITNQKKRSDLCNYSFVNQCDYKMISIL